MAFGDFTVTRASTKNVIGSNGLYQSVANNVPAFEFNTDGSYRGLLVEPGATNQIRNNSMAGAVVGTPGTLPTNYLETLSGLTREVVATGTELGVNYVDLRFSGTSTDTSLRIFMEAAAQIVAANGQVWTNSAFLKVVAAPQPPSSYLLEIFERTSAGGFVTSGGTTVVPTSTLSRFSATRTLSGGVTVERVQPCFRAAISNGVAYDFTIRIGWPQLETGSVATSPIVTTGSTASRVADVVSLTGASSLIGQTSGTIYCEINARNIVSSIFRRAFTISDGTTSNMIQITLSDTSSVVTAIVTVGGVIGASVASTTLTGVLKIAVGYANNDVVLYINGNQIGTDTSVTIPACSKVNIGSRADDTNIFNDHVRSVALFPTRLDNTTLATLTTL
jgi:hypothetical protein